MKKILNSLYFYTAPHFPSRYFLHRDMKHLAGKYKLRGNLLDVGCGEQPYRHYFSNTRYTGIDFKKHSFYKGDLETQKPNLYFSGQYRKDGILPFRSKLFDSVCSFQVMEHSNDPDKLFAEMVRVTKKGGCLLVSIPFIWGLHEEPNDYYRFTEYSIIHLAKKNGCAVIETIKQGGPLTLVEIIFVNYLTELNKKNKIFYLISIPLYFLILIFSYLSVIIETLFVHSNTIFSNYIFLIKRTQ